MLREHNAQLQLHLRLVIVDNTFSSNKVMARQNVIDSQQATCRLTLLLRSRLWRKTQTSLTIRFCFILSCTAHVSTQCFTEDMCIATGTHP